MVGICVSRGAVHRPTDDRPQGGFFANHQHTDQEQYQSGFCQTQTPPVSTTRMYSNGNGGELVPWHKDCV